MPSSAILRMNKALQRTFAHKSKALWTRREFPDESHALTIWFQSTSEEVDADGFVSMTNRPKATVFIGDILAVDPSRVGNESETLRNDGLDTLTIDGVSYRIESCTADGLAKVIVTLRKA